MLIFTQTEQTNQEEEPFSNNREDREMKIDGYINKSQHRLNVIQNHMFPTTNPELQNQQPIVSSVLTSAHNVSRDDGIVDDHNDDDDHNDEFLPIEIVGMGRYLPPFVIPSATVDQMCDRPVGFTEKTTGVKNRRWVQSAEHLAMRRPACISPTFLQRVRAQRQQQKQQQQTSSDDRQEENEIFDDEKVIDVIEMAVHATREATQDVISNHDSDFQLDADLSMVLWASGTQERAIPDSSTLLHNALGLSETGIPSTSIHSTCLSFLQAFQIAAQLLPQLNRRLQARERARKMKKQKGNGNNGEDESEGERKNCKERRRKPYILIASSEAASCGLNFTGNAHSAGLMGDCATSVIVTLPDEYYHNSQCSRCACSHNGCSSNSSNRGPGIHKWLFETYSGGAELTTIRGGGSKRHPSFRTTTDADNFFYMNGKQVLQFTAEKAHVFLEKLRPGLTKGKVEDLNAIIPHQASKAGMQLMSYAFSWPDDKMVKTLYEMGNCISVSLPVTLYEAVKVQKCVKKGEKVLLIGTGAGLSIAGLILTL